MACCVLVRYLLGRTMNRFRRDRPGERVVTTRYGAPRSGYPVTDCSLSAAALPLVAGPALAAVRDFHRRNASA